MSTDAPLGPADYLFTGAGSVPITFAFHFLRPLDPAALRDGLSRALEAFPAIPSVLAKTGENEYAFRGSASGLEFSTCESSQPFSECRSIDRYITPVDSVEGRPLSRISLTKTPDGSVLAASISHALVDGFSFFHFLSTWARLCRGERFLAPDLGREWTTQVPHDDAQLVTAEVVLERCGLHLAGRRSPHTVTSSKEERIPLSKDHVREMLAEAKRDRPEAAFSENDVVTAWLWRKFLPQWMGDSGDADTYMSSPVDCRRIYRALPRHYFGCALSFACATAGPGQLPHGSLGELALLVHNAVRRVTGEFAATSMGTLDLFRRQHGLASMERLNLTHPERGMIVTNLTRMPLHDLDFGAGAPVDFLVHSDVSRSAALLPAEDGITAVVIHP